MHVHSISVYDWVDPQVNWVHKWFYWDAASPWLLVAPAPAALCERHHLILAHNRSLPTSL